MKFLSHTADYPVPLKPCMLHSYQGGEGHHCLRTEAKNTYPGWATEALGPPVHYSEKLSCPGTTENFVDVDVLSGPRNLVGL